MEGNEGIRQGISDPTSRHFQVECRKILWKMIAERICQHLSVVEKGAFFLPPPPVKSINNNINQPSNSIISTENQSLLLL